MIRTIIGALVGREIDRRDGEGGAKGAIIGAIASRAVTRMGPLGLLLGGAYVGKKMYDRRRTTQGVRTAG